MSHGCMVIVYFLLALVHQAETLLHSGKPACSEVSLEDYARRHPKVLGIRVLRTKEGG